MVIPAHNEAGSIHLTVTSILETLNRAAVDYEVLVIDDASTDATGSIVSALAAENPHVRYHRSAPIPRASASRIHTGWIFLEGDVVAIVMADGSDDPEDLVRYHSLISKGYDCAFGSRFMRGSSVHDYPRFKLRLNRFVNWGLRIAFRSGYNDTTNAFKAYRREVIETVQPLLSNHFNLTVEIPLKAIVRGHTYAVVPISWRNRTSGESKLALKEMGSGYLSSCSTCSSRGISAAVTIGAYCLRLPSRGRPARARRSPDGDSTPRWGALRSGSHRRQQLLLGAAGFAGGAAILERFDFAPAVALGALPLLMYVPRRARMSYALASPGHWWPFVSTCRSSEENGSAACSPTSRPVATDGASPFRDRRTSPAVSWPWRLSRHSCSSGWVPFSGVVAAGMSSLECWCRPAHLISHWFPRACPARTRTTYAPLRSCH